MVWIFLSFLGTVFFPEFGGSTLDSHHGFVVEYGMDRDLDLGRCFFNPFLLVLCICSSMNIKIKTFLMLHQNWRR